MVLFHVGWHSLDPLTRGTLLLGILVELKLGVYQVGHESNEILAIRLILCLKEPMGNGVTILCRGSKTW